MDLGFAAGWTNEKKKRKDDDDDRERSTTGLHSTAESRPIYTITAQTRPKLYTCVENGNKDTAVLLERYN